MHSKPLITENVNQHFLEITVKETVPNNEMLQIYLNNRVSNFTHTYKFTTLSGNIFSDKILKISINGSRQPKY